MNGFIYIIKNTINSKVYIGQTKVSVQTRWKEHLRHARYGDQVINRAMRKYGTDKFYIETLEICNLEVIDEREMYYIELYDSTNKSKGYNVSIGGNTPRFKRKILPIVELINLYVNDKFSTIQLAKKFNVSIYIINTELKNAGVQLRPRHISSSKYAKLSKEDIIKVLSSTTSLRQAAKRLGISTHALKKAFKYHNIEYNSSTSAQHQKQ